MALVKATTDEAFVVEVAEEVSSACTRMNTHVSSMIEEYLQRRIQEVRDAAAQEMKAMTQQMEQQVAEARAAATTEMARHEQTKAQLTHAAAALQNARASRHTADVFHAWQRYADVRRERRRLADEACAHLNGLAVSRAYTLWRLFAAARRHHGLEAAELHRRDCREQELLGQIEVYQTQLEEERTNNADLSDKLKEAFVRGVCALNREAVQVLHGPEESQNEDVEAIAEILSRESNSHHHSAFSARVDTSTPSNPNPSSVCPVHHVDSKGVFYHPCYAPGYCEVDRRSASRAAGGQVDVPSSTSGRLVVRADIQSARSIDSAPSVPLRHLSRPSQTRWRK